MKIGYDRVSTTGQKLEVQFDKLTAAGCERIFEEKRSGASRDERDALRQALTFIREGDQFVITRLLPQVRSVLDLSQITAEIAVKKVDLVVLDQSIDTGSPTGRLLFHMLAASGEFERDLIKERTADEILLSPVPDGFPTLHVAHGARTSRNSQRRQCSRDQSAESGAIVFATSIAALLRHRPLASSRGPVSGSAAPAVKTERGTQPHYGAGLRPFDRDARSALPIDRHEAAIPAGSDPRREYAMSSKTTITNRPSHRLFAVTKADGQDKASWLEIGAAWPNKDGKGFSLKLKALPMPGSEIVLRIVEPSEAKA